MSLVMEPQLCFNCLQTGHFVPQCASDCRRHKCRKLHHALLHLQSVFEHVSVANTAGRDTKKSLPAKRDDSSTSHTSHFSSPKFGGEWSLLIITCQVMVVTSDGCLTKARALLDCASSTLFVTERLVRRVQVPHQRQCVQVASIGGSKHKLSHVRW